MITSDNMENKEEDPKTNPKNCQFESYSCGNYVLCRGIVGCVKLKDLNQDVGPLFDADICLTEYDLICLRSPKNLDPEGLICAKHVFTLGKGYRASSRCKYLDHPLNSKAKGLKIS